MDMIFKKFLKLFDVDPLSFAWFTYFLRVPNHQCQFNWKLYFVRCVKRWTIKYSKEIIISCQLVVPGVEICFWLSVFLVQNLADMANQNRHGILSKLLFNMAVIVVANVPLKQERHVDQVFLFDTTAHVSYEYIGHLTIILRIFLSKNDRNYICLVPAQEIKRMQPLYTVLFYITRHNALVCPLHLHKFIIQ